MQLPLQVTFRNMPRSDAVETKIRERADKLDKFYNSIMSCRVIVEAPHAHHHQGKLFHLRIDLTVPQGELVVSKDAHADRTHEDVYVAIRDAFDAAQRQLQNYARKQRRNVKTHEAPPRGKVTEVFPHMDYGLIHTNDGREVYFHRNSVINGGFDHLELGTPVRFAEEMGEKGPQASTVTPSGKHQHLS
jgi:ribosomal subunit interface protein